MTGEDSAGAMVRRYIAASPERVFAAFADAEMVARWLSPAPEILLTVQRYDFRVGGLYRFAYRLSEQAPVLVGGVFEAIEAPSRLEFSWIIEPPDIHAGIASRVGVTIAAREGGCELMIRHDKFDRADAIARHAEGWRGALDQLARLLGTEGARR